MSIEYICKENVCISYNIFVYGFLYVYVFVFLRFGAVGRVFWYRFDGGSIVDCWSNSGFLFVYEVRVIMNLLFMNL